MCQPPTRCQTVFDQPEYTFLNWSEVQLLTTHTPFCNGYETNDCECSFCNISLIAVETCPKNSTYEDLYNCTQTAKFQSQFNWTKCDDYAFDRMLRPNSTNLFFDKGEPWETVVTQFGLVCDQNWLSALAITLATVGDFVGAIFAGVYVDRFGRKNGIVTATVVLTVAHLVLAFMPTFVSFLIVRTLLTMIVVCTNIFDYVLL